MLRLFSTRSSYLPRNWMYEKRMRGAIFRKKKQEFFKCLDFIEKNENIDELEKIHIKILCKLSSLDKEK